MGRGRKPFLWALYQGEELLDMGTTKEIAARRGITEGSLLFLRRPARLRRVAGYEGALALVRVDEDAEV
jgi:hypothetical protein